MMETSSTRHYHRVQVSSGVVELRPVSKSELLDIVGSVFCMDLINFRKRNKKMRFCPKKLKKSFVSMMKNITLYFACFCCRAY